MSALQSRAEALISAAALTHNLTVLSRRARAKLLLPVKANAYGHGEDLISQIAAVHAGVWGLAVSVPLEAAEVAALNPGTPIVLLTPPIPEELPLLADLGVRVPVATLEEAGALPAHAKAHLKVDTGMNRLGARPDDAVKVGLRLAERGQLEGAYTHFATADEEDLSFADEQFRRFQGVLAQLPPVLAHCANGGAILSYGELPGMSLARPGLASYGFAPPHLQDVLNLRPVMTLRARVTALRTVQPGETVSYGNLWRADAPTRVATVGVGYADGYPRNATLKAHVIVSGERRPVLGRICMDQCMIDVTGLNVQVGDWVNFWGESGVTVTDVAAWGDTNEYEVLTGVGNRVERVLVD